MVDPLEFQSSNMKTGDDLGLTGNEKDKGKKEEEWHIKSNNVTFEFGMKIFNDLTD